MLDERRQEMTLGQKVNMLVGLAQIVSSPLLVLLRRWGTMGDRAAGGKMALGCLGLFFYLGLSGEPGVGAGALAVLLLGLLVHRARHARLVALGYDVHSLYTGVPWLRGDEASVKGGKEPVLVAFLGLFTLPFSMALGSYLIVAGLCLGVVYSHFHLRMQAQARAMRDARHERELLMEYARKEVD